MGLSISTAPPPGRPLGSPLLASFFTMFFEGLAYKIHYIIKLVGRGNTYCSISIAMMSKCRHILAQPPRIVDLTELHIQEQDQLVLLRYDVHKISSCLVRYI